MLIVLSEASRQRPEKCVQDTTLTTKGASLETLYWHVEEHGMVALSTSEYPKLSAWRCPECPLVTLLFALSTVVGFEPHRFTWVLKLGH